MKKLTILIAIILIASSAFTQNSFDNEFYFRIGYSHLTDEDYNENVDFGTAFEIGTIFMIKGIPLPDNMSFGIDVDYASINWYSLSSNSSYGSYNSYIFRFDSKVGPSFTYSPVTDMFLDAFIKADINIATLAFDEDAEDIYGGFGKVGFATGVNFRYKLLMLGIEYNKIEPKLKNLDDDNGYSDKISLPSINFTIGLNF